MIEIGYDDYMNEIEDCEVYVDIWNGENEDEYEDYM